MVTSIPHKYPQWKEKFHKIIITLIVQGTLWYFLLCCRSFLHKACHHLLHWFPEPLLCFHDQLKILKHPRRMNACIGPRMVRAPVYSFMVPTAPGIALDIGQVLYPPVMDRSHPFYRCRIWSTKELSNFPKVKQLLGRRARLNTR